MEILVPYLHFIGIMSLMGCLIAEHLILKPGIDNTQVKILAGIDLVYGIAAVVVLGSGLLRWFIYGKGADYYLHNSIFHVKLTLFVIVVILSIFPTVKFLKWRKQAIHEGKADTHEKAVKRMLMFIRIELTIVAIIPLLAVMVAHGTGM